MARASGLVISAALASILISTIASAQDAGHPVTKAEARKNVQVPSILGWSEFISEESRFRILFPGPPKIDDDVSTAKGFKVKDASGQWAAWCSDMGRVVPNENAALKAAYQGAIDSMVRGKDYVLATGEVFLYGRLGTEIILHKSGRTDYIRAFIFGRRLYLLTVTRKKTPGGSGIPADVQGFFDSFAYWD